MGSAFSGVALPSDGAGSFLLNPARLASVTPGVSGSLLARRFEFDAFSSEDAAPYQNAYSLVAGLPRAEAPWRFGVGLGRSVYSVTSIQTGETGEERDTFDLTYSSLVLGGAAAYDGPVTVSAGIAARRLSEPRGGRFDENGAFEFENESDWSVDLGAQVGIPVVRALSGTGFSAGLGVGYALQNWGSDTSYRVDFLDRESVRIPYPLATRARLGWSATFGYDAMRGDRSVRAVEVDIALEASHSLTRQTQEGIYDPPGDPAPIAQPPAYRTAVPLGRIRPLDALLGRSRSPDGSIDTFNASAPGAVGHRSVRLEAFEAATLRLGMHGSPFQPTEETVYSWGAGLSAAGLLRLLAPRSSLAARGDLLLDYAWYELYQDDPDLPELDQPWTLGATLVVRWP